MTTGRNLRRWRGAWIGLWLLMGFTWIGAARADDLKWTSAQRYRVCLKVDPRGRARSNSPARVDFDFPQALRGLSESGQFDEHTVEVAAYAQPSEPLVFDASRPGNERFRLPHRVEKYFGTSRVTLHFVVPDEKCTEYAVYFDTVESKLGRPERYPGLVGDGDFFREGYGRREINASRFDCFCDFDGDGDLDLFKGGVEPFISCYENVGQNRMVERGRLTSGGQVFAAPTYPDGGRGWMAITLNDWDDDGDADLFCSMGDGPKAGQILIYENVTAPGGELRFQERGSLQTAGGTTLGGRFVAVTMVDWDGDGRKDVLLAGYPAPRFHRNVGDERDIPRMKLEESAPILLDGKEFPFAPAQVQAADMDGDGDLDLFATEGAGPVRLLRNVGTRREPKFTASNMEVVAYAEPYKIGDAHTGVHVADFDGDGKLDFVAGRFWERTPLKQASRPRYYGGLFQNVGTGRAPRFEARDAEHGSPFTERFQICDAVRQNAVRGVDWNNDHHTDLIAGDTDGFLWLFLNETGNRFPVFAPGRKVLAAGQILQRYAEGGHLRPDVVDWNNDGKKDFVVADGGGAVLVYLNVGTDERPRLGPGLPVEADGQPIRGAGGRTSVAVGDWDRDGKKDLILADQEYKKTSGYLFYRNVGTDDQPRFAAGRPILFGGQPVDYVRPNLGEIVDWDGDGKQDLIACWFEVDVRFYRNIGSGKAGEEPRFAAGEGVVLVRDFSVQLVSGADVIDWNGDGDLDILTGQGHGGSGLRFYERDYIEDQLHNTSPLVTAGPAQRKSKR